MGGDILTDSSSSSENRNSVQELHDIVESFQQKAAALFIQESLGKEQVPALKRFRMQIDAVRTPLLISSHNFSKKHIPEVIEIFGYLIKHVEHIATLLPTGVQNRKVIKEDELGSLEYLQYQAYKFSSKYTPYLEVGYYALLVSSYFLMPGLITPLIIGSTFLSFVSEFNQIYFAHKHNLISNQQYRNFEIIRSKMPYQSFWAAGIIYGASISLKGAAWWWHFNSNTIPFFTIYLLELPELIFSLLKKDPIIEIERSQDKYHSDINYKNVVDIFAWRKLILFVSGLCFKGALSLALPFDDALTGLLLFLPSYACLQWASVNEDVMYILDKSHPIELLSSQIAHLPPAVLGSYVTVPIALAIEKLVSPLETDKLISELKRDCGIMVSHGRRIAEKAALSPAVPQESFVEQVTQERTDTERTADSPSI